MPEIAKDAPRDTRTPSSGRSGKIALSKPTKPVWKMSDNGTVVVIFDSLPPAELHPNYRKTNFWAVRSRVSKIARQEAYIQARLQGAVKDHPIACCELTEIFTFPTKRRIDLEGCMVACKSWIDGLVDAGVLVDDDWSHVTKITAIPRYFPGESQTDIVIRRIEAILTQKITEGH